MSRATSSVRGLHFVPTLISTSVCSAIVVAIVLIIRSKTNGMFVYPLDDSYIHLSIARTLSQHHVWGINPTEFASASSSPAWTVLLAAADLLFGTHLLTPIVINLIIAACLLAAADALILQQAPEVSLTFRVFAGLAIVISTPIPSLVLLGMEHVAQTLLVLLVIWYGAKIASVDPAQAIPAWDILILCLSAGAAGAVRYETAFTVTLVGVMLLWRRRIGVTALLAVCSALGPVAFGMYFHRHSGFWLPFSVIAKSLMGRPPLSDSLRFLMGWTSAPIVMLCFLVWLYRRFSHNFWDVTQILLLLSAAVGTLHSLFAPVGWLMRYDSYFVCLGLIALLSALAQRRDAHLLMKKELFGLRPLPQRLIGVIASAFAVFFILKLAHRIELGFVLPVDASVDRYDEHIQMARFVESNYSHDTIVVNDIGAIEYYSGAKLIDVLGLGSRKSLEDLYKTKTFLPPHLRDWAQAEHASIAIIQIDYSDNRRAIPETWPLVQVWHIPRNLIFRDHSIGFFAVHSTDVDRLCEALKNFQLPKDDVISYDACPQLTNLNPIVRSSVPVNMAKKLAEPPF